MPRETMRPVPVMPSPELKGEREQSQVAEALEAEQLAYNYKFETEEMLSIFDEARENLTYENIVKSKYFTDLPPDLQANIQRHLEQAQSADPRNKILHNILHEDFDAILGADRRLLFKFIAGSLKNLEHNRAKKTQSETKVNSREAEQEIKQRIAGKLIRLAHLIGVRYQKLENSLAAYTDEEQTQIDNYYQGVLPDITDDEQGILKRVRTMRTGIGVAKASKNEESLRSASETAKIFSADKGLIEELNQEIEEILQKDLGLKVEFGTEEQYDEFGNLVNKDNLAAYVNYHREMANLYKLLERGQIVETDAVKKYIEEAMSSLTKVPPTVVYFHGDFGTGKTAMATHIARTRLKSEPVIVSGSKFLDPDRFTEEFRLSQVNNVDFLNEINSRLGFTNKIDQQSPDDIIVAHRAELRQELEKRAMDNHQRDEYLYQVGGEQNFNQADFEKFSSSQRVNTEYLDNLRKEIDGLMDNPVQGRYILGAMYLAMKEGRPLIIDEANAISPDVLIAFNDLLTKKSGQNIQARAGDFTVKEGFCVMWTGNTGDRYKVARYNDMDPASYSRIHPIQVEYLPQSQELSSINQLLGRLDLDQLAEQLFSSRAEALEFVKDSKSKAKNDQIFQVLLVKLLNRRLGAQLLVPNDDRYAVFKDTYRLSMGARIIMDMFEKNADKLPKLQLLEGIFDASEPSSIMEKLNKANLTMRELIDNIMGQYLDEGTNMDIEYYAYKYVRKYDQYPEQQAIIYAVLNKVGFFKDNGWPTLTSVPGKNEAEKLKNFQNLIHIDPITTVNKYKKIDQNGDMVSLLNTKGQYHLEYFSSLETLQMLFGYLPPKTKKQYENIQAIHEERQRSSADQSQLEKQRLEKISFIKEVTGVLSSDRAFFNKSEEIKSFAEQVKSFHFNQPGWLDPKQVPDEQWDAELDRFHSLILDWLVAKKKISAEERQRADQQGAEAKESLIKQALNIN